MFKDNEYAIADLLYSVFKSKNSAEFKNVKNKAPWLRIARFTISRESILISKMADDSLRKNYLEQVMSRTIQNALNQKPQTSRSITPE